MAAVIARDDGERLRRFSLVGVRVFFFFLMKPIAMAKYDGLTEGEQDDAGLTPPRF